MHPHSSVIGMLFIDGVALKKWQKFKTRDKDNLICKVFFICKVAKLNWFGSEAENRNVKKRRIYSNSKF